MPAGFSWLAARLVQGMVATMRRFRCYRPNPPEGYIEQGAANPSDQAQFEGVVFEDGTVCQHWLTTGRSHVIWQSFEDLMKIHGHPEYGTRIEWMDEL